jgi:hypothetical protein
MTKASDYARLHPYLAKRLYFVAYKARDSRVLVRFGTLSTYCTPN